nr:hypothetical protein [Candidatus Cloacimonadota bacterium]
MKKIVGFLTLMLFAATLAFGDISGSVITANTTEYWPGTVNLSFHLDHEYVLNEGLDGISMDFPAGVTVNSAETIVGFSGSLLYDGQTGEGVEVTWTLAGPAWYFGDDDYIVNVTSTLPEGVDNLVIPWVITGNGWGDPPHATSGTIYITTLPVELIAFTAVYTINEYGNEYVSVNWQTASETDVIGFNI